MKTVLVLLDSLNRNYLSSYGGDWVKTPNIDRFAQESITFDQHWLGSAPCMPARRDLFTGRLNFLERDWGPIEPFDITLPALLKEHAVYSHIITDHCHYFETGGENYCQQFNSWDYQRGQEYDPWVSRVQQPDLPKTYYGKASPQYELNRTRFQKEEDFPTPRTFASACQWLQENQTAEQYFLMVEAFDPHEPFDCAPQYLKGYQDDYQGPRFDWSSYAPTTEPPEAIEHLRKRYAATLGMTDAWFGKLLDTLEELSLFEDTLIILTTDHGHLLGEHGWTGKNLMHAYNDLAHLPMMVHLPKGKRKGERIQALTQNIDLMPTLLDYYDIEIPSSVRGKSLRPLWEGSNEQTREALLYGWFGKAVNVTDGKYTYFRAPEREDNTPCHAYCAMPTTLWNFKGKEQKEKIEMGRFLAHTRYPVYKIPTADKGKSNRHINDTQLYDIKNDYLQQKPLQESETEERMVQQLKELMRETDAPEEQFIRLGIQ